MELSAFADEMKSDKKELSKLDKEQERMKSELKAKTKELETLQRKMEKDYSLAKKTVTMLSSKIIGKHTISMTSNKLR